MKLFKTLLPYFLIAGLLFLSADRAFSQPASFSPERTGGVYYAYPVSESIETEAPEGYVPFYVSHYGRHGSRWLPDEARYQWVMRHFDDNGKLTPQGKKVKRRLAKIWANARGNGGKLTPLGARQHEGIARRMVAAFPQVFAEGARVEARSSVVGRCRASMLAFVGEMERQCPWLSIAPETDSAFMSYIAFNSPDQKALEARVKRLPRISPERFVKALFRDASDVDNPLKLLSELHTIASDMQDIPLGISLWDCFTPEEMRSVHEANNSRMTLCNGLTPLNYGTPARSAVSLWEKIAEQADDFIRQGGHGATLRFGHDTNLYRLLTFLQLSLPGEGMEDIIPMAANVQLVFYHKAGDGATADPAVCFLHNERPQRLPIAPLAGTVYFYSWAAVKAYVQARIHSLSHEEQLSKLNTMVGTAQASTQTAGLFGKGSEEHGQTLPAVLVPNGQNFWTPQTQATERKCIAPFYYADTLFQGFRASHWLVGGCTQDYGSFTITPYLSTPGGEARYESHPHYLSAYLPGDGLFAELTALSHTALLRVTSAHDGPVRLLIQANSDEGQAVVAIDTLHRRIYAANPVHRIYQGWGEAAGFSGHLVLTYTDELLDCRTDSCRIWLTFRGRAHEPLLFAAATSFTGREGAEANLRDEAGSMTFEQMMTASERLWEERMHTLDVSDSDSALVSQFYGALYRASFLPREMSDCDGRYPRFADGRTMPPDTRADGSTRRRYGDFSMWDTYRALHPLLTIIAPRQTADMMQSLVAMYEEGGWLPIFPCWNSYTAAMIGDHCSAALADAYVKGIRDFDAEKAYEGMWQNATQQPATRADYENGMGRRALDSYLRYGYIPVEDPVSEAFHHEEQTSRTLEYALDDYCVAQMARSLGREGDYRQLMSRAANWRNVINPLTGYADGRHADGRWEGNTDLVHRKPYITEGATCHYTWYVPHDVEGLIALMGGTEAFAEKLDSMFTEGRYWHGNEPCHQVAWLYNYAGHPEKTAQRVAHILATEYNDTPGGLSGNDDAGQMSAWQLFAMMGLYPVCPAQPQYALTVPAVERVQINIPGRERPFVISRSAAPSEVPTLEGAPIEKPFLQHDALLGGGELQY